MSHKVIRQEGFQEKEIVLDLFFLMEKETKCNIHDSCIALRDAFWHLIAVVFVFFPRIARGYQARRAEVIKGLLRVVNKFFKLIDNADSNSPHSSSSSSP